MSHCPASPLSSLAGFLLTTEADRCYFQCSEYPPLHCLLCKRAAVIELNAMKSFRLDTGAAALRQSSCTSSNMATSHRSAAVSYRRCSSDTIRFYKARCGLIYSSITAPHAYPIVSQIPDTVRRGRLTQGAREVRCKSALSVRAASSLTNGSSAGPSDALPLRP